MNTYFSIEISNDIGLLCWISSDDIDIVGGRAGLSEDFSEAIVFHDNVIYDEVVRKFTCNVRKIPNMLPEELDSIRDM